MKVARDFVSGVQRVTSLIARQPGLGAPWNDTRLSAPVRRVPLTRFPYQIIYVEGDVIQVIAQAHTRRPSRLLDRSVVRNPVSAGA